MANVAARLAASVLARINSSRPSTRASSLLHRRGLAGAADPHGTPKVNVRQDPMSPSKWKEEHGVVQGFDFHEKELESEDSLWDLYERWSSHHTVSRSLDEKHKRFNVFKQNVMYVHHSNKMDKPYKLGLNQFADLTNHEFVTTYASGFLGSKIKHEKPDAGARPGANPE